MAISIIQGPSPKEVVGGQDGAGEGLGTRVQSLGLVQQVWTRPQHISREQHPGQQYTPWADTLNLIDSIPGVKPSARTLGSRSLMPRFTYWSRVTETQGLTSSISSLPFTEPPSSSGWKAMTPSIHCRLGTSTALRAKSNPFQGILVPEKGSEKLKHKEDADPEKIQETNRPQGPWLYLKAPPPRSSRPLLGIVSPTQELTVPWYRASPPQEHIEAWPAHLA